MKKLMVSCLFGVLFLSTAFAQYRTDRTGYEGDYFSLEGAIDLFRNSYNLTDFERQLNTRDNWVNNLDLNYDGRIDYIRVEHRRQGNFHAIILQALLDRYDVQDVAVIEIEVTGRREAILQIVGDEYLYGEEVYVEPVEGYADNRTGYRSGYGSFVNVFYWEPVQYILGRNYHVYVSPYRWQYYPVWWSPWVQCSWNVFRPRITVYHRYYHVVHVHRVVHVHNFYREHRSYSHHVVERTNRVRVSHGKAPIYRPEPAPRQDRNDRGHRSRKDFETQPGQNTYADAPARGPVDSRNKTSASPDQRSRNPVASDTPRATDPVHRPTAKSRKTNPSADQKPMNNRWEQSDRTPRTSAKSSGTIRIPPVQKPAPESRKSPSSADRGVTRSSAPQVNRSSRNTTTRSKTAPSASTSARKPSASNRKATSASPKPKSTAPPKVQQPSRSKTIRSGTKAGSAKQTTKSSVKSNKPASASKSKATKSTGSKKSSSTNSSRKR